jgi:hypothetical protein
MFTRFELEAAVVARQEPSETDEHFPERWMYVKVEITVDIV